MSLATRCTSCGTVFRVVQDQLKVSEGWVRCGRCDTVFNAAEGLFDLEREAPPPWSPTQPPVDDAGTAPWPTADDDRGHPGDGADRQGSRESFHDTAAALGSLEAAAAPAAAPTRTPAPTPTRTPAERVSAAPAWPADEAGATASDWAEPFGSEPVAGPSLGEGAGETPSGFAWHPERRHRSAAALGGASVLLVVLLAAQAAAHFSELAAARWPGLRPVLAGWCHVAGCSIAAPRRIEDVVVDSSTLAPVIGTDALKLAIALRNRAGFAVAVPSVDLSLTDSAGRLLVRRTLNPADFRVASPSLPAGGELPLQALVTAGTATVTGYTVEIFYP